MSKNSFNEGCGPHHGFHTGMRTWSVILASLFVTVPAVSGSVTYTYDQLGRLATVTYSNGVVITYTYDAAGNRVSQATTAP